MELWFTENHTKDVRFSIKVKEHLYHQKSPFQDIDLFNSYEFGVFLDLDGLMMVCEKDEYIYHDMIVHVPMAVNPGIRKVLVIGGGDGGTVRELTRYPGIETIDLVEIDELVVKACREHLPLTAGKLDDPRVNIFYEDGVAFIERQSGAYDLVIIDSTDPFGPGEGLFTRNFYDNCNKALNDRGILVNQHESPYYEKDRKAMTRAHKNLEKCFPIAEVYQFHMPSYPSGHWLFGFASKKLHPVKDLDEAGWKAVGLDTRYYNTELHKGAFALPNYVRKALDEDL